MDTENPKRIKAVNNLISSAQTSATIAKEVRKSRIPVSKNHVEKQRGNLNRPLKTCSLCYEDETKCRGHSNPERCKLYVEGVTDLTQLKTKRQREREMARIKKAELKKLNTSVQIDK